MIGFHIQQAIEKALKSFLANHKIDFRKTHDIRELLDLAQQNNIVIPLKFDRIDEWTPYGVELRYDDIPVDIPGIDRQVALRECADFLEWASLQMHLMKIRIENREA